jgi:hypothetical protein
MELIMQRLWILTILSLSICTISSSFGELMPRAKKLCHAKTVTIDPSFDMYKDRSARSIAEEIVANGYDGVYYFVTSDKGVRKDVIFELQKRDIPVAALIIASGAYLPIEERPKDWEKYRMEFTNNLMDEYKLMSFVHKDYTIWMKNRVVELINKNGFDGFTFAEAMYPISNGLERDDVLYGDISPAFQSAFKKATSNTVFPEFVDRNQANYYKKIPKVYQDLVEFRVKTVNDFYNEVINGNNGVREKCPGIFVATWTLGISIPNGVEKLREWEGNEILSMIRQVKPDMHFIQTHAPDWLNPDLKADYPMQYKSFFDAIKKADPDMPIGFQADLGSKSFVRKPLDWQKFFYDTCNQLKIDSTTYYEFSLRWAIYSEPPLLCKGTRISKDAIELCFDKRISKDCVTLFIDQKKIISDDGKNLTVKSAKVDGNLLKIVLDKDISAKEISVNIGGIKDTPEYRLMLDGTANIIPADTVKKILLQ